MILEPVSIIIPAFNEEKAIGCVLDALTSTLQEAQIPFEILVVDDGSTDTTSAHTSRPHVRLIRHRRKRGYGASLKTGIAHTRFDRNVIIDADGTYPVSVIPRLHRYLDSAEMAVGARRFDNLPIQLRSIARQVLGRLANYLSRSKIPDVNSGLRAFRKSTIEPHLPLLPDSFSFTTTITLSLLERGATIRYLPIRYGERIGKSKISVRDAVTFPFLLLRLIWVFHPLRVFVPIAMLGVLSVCFSFLLMLASPSPDALAPSKVHIAWATLAILAVGTAFEASSQIFRSTCGCRLSGNNPELNPTILVDAS